VDWAIAAEAQNASASAPAIAVTLFSAGRVFMVWVSSFVRFNYLTSK
jgi:hypothetical protein